METDLRVSSKSVYAIQAIFDIAYHGRGEPISGRDIAERETIPQRFLEQILLDLKRAGVLHSKRGPRGGYTLAKASESISLRHIIEAIEGELDETFFNEDSDASDATHEGKDVTTSILRDLATELGQLLDQTSVADLVERGETLGVVREGDDVIFYVI